MDNLLNIFEIQAETFDMKKLDEFRFHFIAGHGGYPLVGTPEQIVDEIDKLDRDRHRRRADVLGRLQDGAAAMDRPGSCR